MWHDVNDGGPDAVCIELGDIIEKRTEWLFINFFIFCFASVPKSW